MSTIVLYRGPSMLDGAPIVALATLGSENAKTGPMVQTWIMRADIGPIGASLGSMDSSVCGDCPRRHSTGGDCYVTIFQAPRSVWAAWDRDGRPGSNWLARPTLRKLQKAAQAHGLRMGSYGDPMAVPWEVWRNVLDILKPELWTGYTHQWRRAWDPETRAWFSDRVMASCDSNEDAHEARARGWRFFLATSPDKAHNLPEQTVLCLAERERNPRTCEECGMCNGRNGRDGRASVYLIEHGARSKGKHTRSAKAKKPSALQVLQ